MYQPQVSAALKRLRELAGDPLLVRSGAGMVPTDAALRMIEPSASILRAAEMLFSDARGFDPASATHHLPRRRQRLPRPAVPAGLVAQVKRAGAALPHRDPPAVGRLRLPRAAGAGRHRRGDRQLAASRPATCTGRSCSPTKWCAWWRRTTRRCGAAGPPTTGWRRAHRAHAHPPRRRGVIDEHLETQGLARNITARCPHFGLIPAMVASSLLVLTTGRQFCERYLQRLPVPILPPGEFPPLVYYQLWHERSQASAAGRWLRTRTKAVAAGCNNNDDRTTP
jgi:DNA-binding transcriptional LysR family regulator